MTRRRRPQRKEYDAEDHLAVVDEECRQAAVLAFWPQLWTYLMQWERQGLEDWVSPTLTLWHDGALWRGSLHDRIHHQVSYASAPDLDALLAFFSEGLRRGTLRWRSPRP